MKRNLFYLAILIILMVSVTGCSKNKQLEEIAKNINNCESVTNYKEYDYIIKAITKNDTLTIATTFNDKTSKVDFVLKDNILSNENLSNNDLMPALLVLNGVGQTYGYKDGELSNNINTFTEDFQKYSLDKDGLELIITDDNVSLKIDITKKIKLIDMNKFYLKDEDLDIISNLIIENKSGNQSGKIGNIAYDIFIDDSESSIQIGQDGKLSDSAYKSILSAIEVIYGKEASNKFQKLYPSFKDGKVSIEEFTIEKDYKIEDQNDSIFKDTEIVLVTINNKLKK